MNAQPHDDAVFNGIDAVTGGYLPSPSVEDISRTLRGGRQNLSSHSS